MSAFDRSSIDAVKSRLRIADIVGRYVELRRMGARLMAPCPFHQETKPSFSVNEEEGLFYCFGCQASGDIIDFYCRINGLEFYEGLQQLAQEAGITLESNKPYDKRAAAQARAQRSEKQTYLAMYAEAARLFQANLNSQAGDVCRQYLADRAMSAEVVQTFEMGYSLPAWDNLLNHLRSKGYTEKQAADAGLASRNQQGRVYDRFRGRLMFPIKNLSNQVIAFGGRVINPEDDPKYINSSETLIYTKGDHLYGLSQARRVISQHRTVLLTEGYVDVITLHQYGYGNACGVLGTALTPNQVKRLAGFCSNVDLLFDGDNAGRKAALRSAEMILTQGLKCRVALLPDGEDIDSLLHAHGAEGFNQLMGAALDGFEYCVRTVRESRSPKEMLDWAETFSKGLKTPELNAYYLPRLATGLGLSELELRRNLAAKQNKTADSGDYSNGPGHPKQHYGRGANAGPQPRQMNPAMQQERQLLSFAIRFPHHIPLLQQQGAADFLSAERSKRLWEKLANAAGADVVPYLTTHEKQFYTQCRMSKAELDQQEEAELQGICRFLESARARREKQSYLSAVRSGQGDDFELLRALQKTLGRNDG